LVEAVVIDSDDIVNHANNFRPDDVILDVDSLRIVNSLAVATTVREIASGILDTSNLKESSDSFA
jgi:hypothetical protein